MGDPPKKCPVAFQWPENNYWNILELNEGNAIKVSYKYTVTSNIILFILKSILLELNNNCLNIKYV